MTSAIASAPRKATRIERCSASNGASSVSRARSPAYSPTIRPDAVVSGPVAATQVSPPASTFRRAGRESGSPTPVG
jgi:hypothetical protein